MLLDEALKREEENDHKVETICKNCVFAQWTHKDSDEDGHENKTVRLQTGCQIDLIRRFKDRDVKIEEYVDNKSGDEFMSIVGRACMYNRPNKWKKQFGENHNLIDEARKEITVVATLVVYFGDEHTPEQLQKTLKSINDSVIQPKEVIVVFDFVPTRPSEVKPMMDKYCKIPWRTEFTVRQLGISGCIDLCAKKTQSTFIVCLFAGKCLPYTLLHKLDVMINEQLEQIMVWLSNDHTLYNQLIIHRMLVKRIAGQHQGNLIAKALYLLEQQECQHLIKKSISQ